MSRGPNSLNLNAYSQGEGANQDDDRYQMDQTDRDMEVETIEEQFDNFVKDIENYN